ncbi:BACON domain-containing protein [Rubellicoccus peritrichatus]|uniref:BACON domain-containing protein n=1 Tax=Rubellicoccus peritrichatus TaxID=3080537 RepID=A0AAQ3L7T6_9BACT|nr:hypothetical protein [Puniceicoccus sp. CR14]WOO40257.1 hypothetical protein RZN69_16685 [Puniceicoccus sp. CR14]
MMRLLTPYKKTYKGIFVILLLQVSIHVYGQGTILPGGARDIGLAGAAYEHPRLYFGQSDKAAMLARRTGSAYYSAVAAPRITSTVNAANSTYDALADIDLTTPDWTFIESTFVASEGRNQSWGIASTEAWLTDDDALKDQMIKIITNYARIILYAKDLADGVYASNVVSSSFYSTVQSVFYRNDLIDSIYYGDWSVTEQWIFGGAGLALSYDVLYNDMTDAERDVVRAALAVATTDRYSYGANMPKGRAISNHYGYHGEMAVMLLAIKDETGFDAGSFSRIRQVLLDYWEIGLTPEGICHEDTYGPNLGFREGMRGLMALARNDADDNIFITDKLKKFANATAQQIEPREGGYLMGGASGTDLGNHPTSVAHIYPTSLILLKYFLPNDPVADYIWRWVIGDNHSNVIKVQSVSEYCMFGLDVNSSFSTLNTLEGSGLPLTQFYPRRGKLITRSDWSQDALYFQLDARPDAFMIGHDKVDRGNFYLTALNEPWAVNPPWNVARDSQYQSLVHIDGLAQPWKAASVDFLEHSDDGQYVKAASDLSYAYSWQWSPPWPNSGTSYPAPWEQELSDPRDLGWPDDPSWLPSKIHGETGIGYIGSYMHRQPYNPVVKVFRSSLMARGVNPYLLMIDDVQKDNTSHDYRWQMALPDDVQIDSQSGRDIILGRSADPAGAKLLVRIVEAVDTTGVTPTTITASLSTTALTNYDSNVLQFSVNSISPKFKVLLFPYQPGVTLPTTSLAGDVLTIGLPDGSTDLLVFSEDSDGRTLVDVNGTPPAFSLGSSSVVSSGIMGEPLAPQNHSVILTNNQAAPLDWSTSLDQSWLHVTPSSGTLGVGENIALSVSFLPAVSSLSIGEHIAEIQIQDTPNTLTRTVNVGVTWEPVPPDSVPTEVFSGGDTVDLDFKQITFVPNGSDYVVMTDTITSLPYTHVSNDALENPRDDSFWTQNPAWTSAPVIGGTSVSTIHIGSNGLITFEAGSGTYTESVTTHFSRRQLSPLWDDLSPNQSGTVYYKFIAGDRAVITYEDVPEFSAGNDNTVQVEIFDDGSNIIRFSYLRVDANDAVVGVSGGTGTPDGWSDNEIDFTGQYGLPVLTMATPDAETAELASSLDRSLTVLQLDRAVSYTVPVRLRWSGSAEIDEISGYDGGVVNIAAGLTETQLMIEANDDSLPEGTESFTLTPLDDPHYKIASGQSSLITVIDVPMDAWRLANGQIGVDLFSDDDMDGMELIAEYALGGDLSGTQETYTFDLATGEIVLSNLPVPEDVQLDLEWSLNLVEWSSDGVTRTESGFVVSGASGERLFFRFTVTP